MEAAKFLALLNQCHQWRVYNLFVCLTDLTQMTHHSLIHWLTDWLVSHDMIHTTRMTQMTHTTYITHIMHSQIDSQTDWLTDSLAGCLTDWLPDSLTHWLTDSLTDWLTDWLPDSLTHSLTHWLTDWLTHSLADWLTIHSWPKRHKVHRRFIQIHRAKARLCRYVGRIIADTGGGHSAKSILQIKCYLSLNITKKFKL